MATVTQSYTDNHIEGSATNSWKKTWTVSYTQTDIVVSGSSFTYTTPTLTAKFTGTTGGKYRTVNFEIDDIKIGNTWIEDYWNRSTGSYPFHPNNVTGFRDVWRMSEPRAAYNGTGISGTSGSTFSVGKRITDVDNELKTNVHSGSCMTSDFFNENNNTEKKLNITIKFPAYGIDLETTDGASSYNGLTYYTNGSALSYVVGSVTLNAPPTIQVGTPTYTEPRYTGFGAYTVPITSATAQYGGDITSIKLQIGNDSIVQTYSANSIENQTISLIPTAAGSFTPKIIVTDSRGQETPIDLDPITVNQYITNISNLAINRVKESTPNQFSQLDEGTNAVLLAKFNYSSDTGAELIAPIVTIKDSNNNSITPTITWYTSWNSSTGVFGSQVTWENISSGTTLYGKITNTFSQDETYTFSIQPRTTVNSQTITGEIQSIILSKSFFLLVGRPGGKGLGIGKKPEGDYLDIGMMTHVEQDVNIGQYYDNSQQSYAFTIGNGTSNNARSNAAIIDWGGNYMGQGMAGQVIMFAGGVTQSVSDGIATTNGAPPGWLSCNGDAVSRTYYAKLFAIIGTTYGSGDGSTTFNLPNFRGRVPVGVGTAENNNSTANATATGAVQGATSHTRGEMSGEETHELTTGETATKAHSHTYTKPPTATDGKALTTANLPAHTHGSESLTGYFNIRPYSTSGSNILGTSGIVSASNVSSTSYNGVSGASSGDKYQKITIDATHTHNSVGSGTTHSHDITNTSGTTTGNPTNASGTAHNNMPPYSVINYLIATGRTY